MSFYFLDTSALVKRYHLELGTEIVDAVFAENSSTKMISDLGVIEFYPPPQKATGVNPWMNARWVPPVALAKEGVLRRVPPDDACGGVPRQ
jgi:hypothetical protein